jgi:hypothetical protein
VLLRRVIGDALRARRQAQHRTLREVSTAANVSLGYLSEIERGQKEASSELLAAICEALGAALSEVLRDVSDTLALAEEMRGVLVPVNVAGDGAAGDGVAGGSGDESPAPLSPAAPGVPTPAAPAATAVPAQTASATPTTSNARVSDARVSDARVPNAKVSIAAGRLSVAVRRDGPFMTTLTASRPARARDVVAAA